MLHDDLSQVSTIESPKSFKISKFCKKSVSKRTQDQDLGKDFVSKGSNNEIDNAYTLSAVFRETQCSPKTIKMEATMECVGTQNHKNPATRTFTKTATSWDRKKCIFGLLGGVVERSFFNKNHNNPRNRPYCAPVRASKMTARASKMIENLITLLIKIKALAVKQTRRSEQTEKWHGGGICAQRTGYT